MTPPEKSAEGPAAVVKPSFKEALRFWAKLGFINFGGPAGQIAIMHEELVERKRWIGENRFLRALNFCMLLPGPEAQQLAVYIGWLLHGRLGGFAAGILFILPAFFLIFALAWIHAAHGSVPWIAAIFASLRGVVIAIVAVAIARIGKRALRTRVAAALAAAAFAGIYFFAAPFPLIVLGAGLIGLIGARLAPEAFPAPGHGPAGGTDEPEIEAAGGGRQATLKSTLGTVAVGLFAWWAPLLAVIAWRGAEDTLSLQAVFFSKAAMVTFGGAYAVLTYIAQAAVETYGWLEPRQMIDGLALAESTPGPLIMVTEFTGFLAAYRHPGDLPPLAAGALGACVATWATFAPCFLWIFAGAPHVERLGRQRALGAALAAITAAVVGVIANLTLWFSVHALFGNVQERRAGPLRWHAPEWGTLDAATLAVAAAALALLWKWKQPMARVVGFGVAAGVARALFA